MSEPNKAQPSQGAAPPKLPPGYQGNIDSQGKPHGQGRQNFAEGAFYDGAWDHGHRHGIGRLNFANGDVYLGAFVNDRRCGRGKYKFKGGSSYDGHWKDDKRHGRGILLLTKEASQSMWRPRLPRVSSTTPGDIGSSTMTAKSAVSTPTVSEGSHHPPGYHLSRTIAAHKSHIQKYEGEFEGDQFSGAGSLTFTTGAKYRGQFAEQSECGTGVFIFPNGDYIDATWKLGVLNGPAQFVAKKAGKSFQVNFSKGLMVVQPGSGKGADEVYEQCHALEREICTVLSLPNPSSSAPTAPPVKPEEAAITSKPRSLAIGGDSQVPTPDRPPQPSAEADAVPAGKNDSQTKSSTVRRKSSGPKQPEQSTSSTTTPSTTTAGTSNPSSKPSSARTDHEGSSRKHSPRGDEDSVNGVPVRKPSPRKPPPVEEQRKINSPPRTHVPPPPPPMDRPRTTDTTRTSATQHEAAAIEQQKEEAEKRTRVVPPVTGGATHSIGAMLSPPREDSSSSSSVEEGDVTNQEGGDMQFREEENPQPAHNNKDVEECVTRPITKTEDVQQEDSPSKRKIVRPSSAATTPTTVQPPRGNTTNLSSQPTTTSSSPPRTITDQQMEQLNRLLSLAKEKLLEGSAHCGFGMSIADCEVCSPFSRGVWAHLHPEGGRRGSKPTVTRVLEIAPGSPAEALGIARKDFLIAINGKKIKKRRDMVNAPHVFHPGDVITLVVCHRAITSGSTNNNRDISPDDRTNNTTTTSVIDTASGPGFTPHETILRHERTHRFVVGCSLSKPDFDFLKSLTEEHTRRRLEQKPSAIADVLKRLQEVQFHEHCVAWPSPHPAAASHFSYRSSPSNDFRQDEAMTTELDRILRQHQSIKQGTFV